MLGRESCSGTCPGVPGLGYATGGRRVNKTQPYKRNCLCQVSLACFPMSVRKQYVLCFQKWNYQEVCRGAVDAKQDISLLWPYIILIALGVYTCALCIVECGCYKFIHEMNVVI